MPLLDMPHPNNDGGYAVQDFDTVDRKSAPTKTSPRWLKLRRAGISLHRLRDEPHRLHPPLGQAAEAGDPEYQDYYASATRTAPSPTATTGMCREVFRTPRPATSWNEKMNK